MLKTNVNNLKQDTSINTANICLSFHDRYQTVKMDGLIRCVNKLQKVSSDINYGNLKWELPEIVVIGNQSDGKSSVLESIVGEDFLPKGGGTMVTKRPIALQLHHIGKGAEEEVPKPYALLDGQYIPDFQTLKKNIEIANNVGPKNDITDKQIILQIYSPDVMQDLTLIDLPGLFKVRSNDQVENLPKRIETLVREYAKRKNTIMLVVASATSDLNTSVALELAKDVDPEGERTLVVLTKADMEDKAACKKIKDTLLGHHIKVKLGIIAVINRSESDVLEQKPVKEKRKEESLWFEKHLNDLASRNGTVYLAQRLSKILSKNIKQCFPELTRWIHDARAKNNAIVAKFAPDSSGFIIDKETIVFGAIQKFCNLVKSIIEGPGTGSKSNQICGGRLIYNIFVEKYRMMVEQVSEPLMKREHIKTVAQNFSGYKPNLFISEKTLEKIVEEFIENIRKPSLDVADETKLALDIIVENACDAMDDSNKAYQILMKRLPEQTAIFLKFHLTKTKLEMEKWLHSECCYTNINHIDFDQYVKNVSVEKTTPPPQYRTTLGKSYPGNKRETYDKIGGTRVDVDVKNIAEDGIIQSDDMINTTHGFSSDYDILDLHKSTGTNAQPGAQPRVIGTDDYFDSGQDVYGQSIAVSQSLDMSLQTVENAACAYIRIIKKTALDRVPKIVAANLVEKVKNELVNYLHKTLYNAGNLEQLVAESPEVTAERENAYKMLQVCDNALKEIDMIQSEFMLD